MRSTVSVPRIRMGRTGSPNAGMSRKGPCLLHQIAQAGERLGAVESPHAVHVDDSPGPIFVGITSDYDGVRKLGSRLTDRAQAAGAEHAGGPLANLITVTLSGHRWHSTLLARARQLQALVRRQPIVIRVAGPSSTPSRYLPDRTPSDTVPPPIRAANARRLRHSHQICCQ